MSDTLETLRGKIGGAEDLESVVRSMKALAASSIGQYEKSVLAVGDYYRTVEMGLAVCLRQSGPDTPERSEPAETGTISAVVFGSDQGLVGQFNDVLAEFVVSTLAPLPGRKSVWAVGERIHARLTDAGLPPAGLFPVPTSVGTITPLIGQILTRTEAGSLYLFHNGPKSETLYEPQVQRLLPLDRQWQQDLTRIHWPTTSLPEVLGDREETLLALVHEYLFVSLFRACAESLASENASRLAAMQRAEKNIDELLDGLHQTFNRQRQSSIDEEMFDVISGFEAQKT
ncbi:MAG: F0F1 ATP synthase subunit gamma [Janthinobacterium lividum]